MKTIPFKIGFIGGSINSAVGTTHKIASQMDNKWELVSGCFSTNSEVNFKTAMTWGVDKKRTYSDWKELLDNEKSKLDAVCILTPTSLHSEMILNALDKGYNIISEKTISTNYDDAVKIVKKVKKTGRFFSSIYNYTGYPMLRELKKKISKGDFGRIFQFQVEMPQEGFLRYYDGKMPNPQKWRMKDYEVPTISLDLGVHLHHIIYFLSGEKPLEVIADQKSYGHFRNIVDNVICMARYTNNVMANIWYSKSALGHRNGLRIRVYGEKLSAEWYQMNPEILNIFDSNGGIFILDRAADVEEPKLARYNRFKSGHPAGYIEAFANHYYDIAESYENYLKKNDSTSDYVFDEKIAAESINMLEAISVSTKTNIWTPLRKDIN
jgi:predicted dehydrogenase